MIGIVAKTATMLGCAGILLAVGAWVYGMDQTKEQISEQRAAIVKIGERVNIHISKQRYQECYERCVEPAGCPPEPQPLPPNRCAGSR